MAKGWLTDFAERVVSFADLQIAQRRIINANFAEKIVTTAVAPSTQPTVALGGITEGIFGRKVFIMVDTENMQGEDVTIELIRHDDGTNDVLNITDGTADVCSFTATVGDTTALDDAAGNNPYSNLVDFEDKAIFKIDIRPHARADFDIWAQQINTATAPSIKIQVKPADSTSSVCYGASGNDDSTNHPDGFIFGNYDLENKNVYEIYHQDNPFNFNPNFNDYGNTQRRQPISKLINESTDNVIYIYRDLDDNAHEVCESEVFEVNEKTRIATIPANYLQAQTAFEDVLLNLNPHPTRQNTNIPIFTYDTNQVTDALVQNSLTETPDDLFQMLTAYRNIINSGSTDAQIMANLATRPQNIQTFVNNSTAAQRASMLIIDNVIDQTSYALEGVDARFTCEYPLGVVTSGDTSRNTHLKRYYRNVVNATTNTNVTTKLINAQFLPLVALANRQANQPALNYTSGTLTIGFSYRASRRRYANPDLFAGIIGALAQLNYAHNTAHVVSTGFSFPDASCYPSVTHTNGEACDTLFFNQIGSLAVYQQPLINALWDYGFNSHLSAFNYTHVTLDANHNDHLHSYRFNRYSNQNNRNFIKTIL